MKLSKALILLRLCRDEAIAYLLEHSEKGMIDMNNDFEINDEQYLALYNRFSEDWNECCVGSYYGYYNDEYNELKPTNHYIYTQKKEIHLGLILQCNKESFGILVGMFGDKIYYFDKEENLIISKYHLVSFILDKDDSNKAICVSDIDKYEIVSNDSKRIMKPDGYYCDKDEWKAMQRGIPFISMSRHLCCLYYPESKTNGKVYFEQVLNKSCAYAINLSLYLKALSFIPSVEVSEINNECKKIRHYVDNFDEKGTIETFKVIEDGHLIHKCHKDNYFVMTTSRTINTKDPYICFLLSIGDKTTYEDCVSEDYHYVNEEATGEGKNYANEEYDKDIHFAFLLKKYSDSRYDIIRKRTEFELRLRQLFNIGKFEYNENALFFYSGGYKTVVARYNNP